MNRTVVLALVTVSFLSACLPLPIPGQPTAAPTVNVAATDAILAETGVAQTLNALPTPTLPPATETPQPTTTSTEASTATQTVPATLTSDPNITATTTGTATVSSQINPTATITLHPRFFGTLPPAIPYGKVRLINKAKADVYVSLQCTTIDGYKTIIEYPVFGRLRVSAPAGKYNYVAWVGGRQFLGTFSLGNGDELTITFKRDKISIE